MHLTLHLFKKDLRRTHLLLAFWILLVAVQYAFMAASLRPGDRAAQMTYGTISGISPILQGLVLAVLVALLVQEESPAGTTGFWLTRPMSRSAVLRTKVMFGAILVVLPVLAEAIVFVAAGVTWHDIALAVPEIVLGELQVMLSAAVLAAVTSNFARFAIAGAVAWVASYLISVAAGPLQNFLVRFSPAAPGYSPTLYQSQRIAYETLIALGLGTAFVYQYLTRRTVRAVAIAVAVELGGIAINNAWRWDFCPPTPRPAPTVKLDLEGIQVTLQSSQVADMPDYRNPGLPKKNESGNLLVAGLPEGVVALPRKISPRLTQSDGRAIEAKEPGQNINIFDPPSSLFETALGRSYVYGRPWEGSGVWTNLVLLDADGYRRHVQQPLTYSAEIEFNVERFVVTARMPIEKGSHADSGSEHEFITDVLRDGDRIHIVLHRRYMNLLFARLPTEDILNAYRIEMDPSFVNRTYVLFNRKSREAIRTEMNGISRLSGYFPLGRLMQATWQISFGPSSNALTPELNEAWMADAELIELQLKPAAEFTKSLTVKNFILDQQYKPPGPPPPPRLSDPIWLTRFVLPEHATKAQMKEYAYDVMAASQYWHAESMTELPVTMLAKVGSGNADVLLGTIDRVAQYYMGSQILLLSTLRVSGPEDKAAVLQALAANPTLVDLVVKYNWQADCRDTLIAALRDEKKNSLPRGWITAIAKLQDPATYPDLKAYLVRTRNRQMTYNEIRKLPGIDLRTTIDASWKQAKSSTHSEVVDATAMAIDVGYPDALEVLVNILRADDISQPQQITRALTLVRRYIPATGDAAALVAWYDANKDNLVFNARRGKFLPAAGPK